MRLIKLAAWAILPLALLLSGGCTTTTTSSSGATKTTGSLSPQRDLQTLRAEVATLKDQTRLAEMRAGGDSTADVARLRAESQRLFQNVTAIGSQEGQNLRRELDYVAARLDNLERYSAQRTAEPVMPETVAGSVPGDAEAASSAIGYPGGAYQYPATVPETAPTETAAQRAPASTVPLPPPSTGPYESGKSYFDQKKYGEAVSQFKVYLAAEPKGSNAATAQFYIGESMYAQQRYEEAILEYQKVVRGFPKSSQVPTSLLKQGLSFQAIGEKDSAKLLYQKVVRDYPKSYAAGVAKERLTKI